MSDRARPEQVDYWLSHTSRALVRPRPARLIFAGVVGFVGLALAIVAIASLPPSDDARHPKPPLMQDDATPSQVAAPPGV